MLTAKQISNVCHFHAEVKLYETALDVSNLVLPEVGLSFQTLDTMLPKEVVSPLYEAYPMLVGLLIQTVTNKPEFCGYLDPRSWKIVINVDFPIEEQVNTFVHELQHAFQMMDKRPGGTSLEQQFMSVTEKYQKVPKHLRFLVRGYLARKAFKRYLNNQGEIEARLAEVRNNYTVEQFASIPWTDDVKVNFKHFNVAE